MKIRHKFLLIAIIVALLTLQVGCVGSKAESKLVGKWQLIKDVKVLFFTYEKGSEIEFYKNGELDFMGIGYKYEVVEDKIKIFDEEGAEFYNYQLEGDNLTLHIEGTGILTGKVVSLEFARVK